jgi:hypothetical protein
MRAGAVVAALAAALILGASSPAAAQEGQEVRTISPGMTDQVVRDTFGEPLVTRSRGEFTYYFYDNGCEKECGFLDLVIFQGGQVVDAVLRAPWHEYTGQSSSPKGVQVSPNRGGDLQVPEGRVEGVEVRPARDTLPSRPGS